MSFSSANDFLRDMGVTNETATDEQRKEALWMAFEKELPAGMSYLKALAEKARQTDETAIGIHGHTEDTIKDCQRLVGNSVPRAILEEKLGVPFESYNCHYPVTAPNRKKLKVSLQTQIDLQNGNLASVNC